jgi:hypothetical protein
MLGVYCRVSTGSLLVPLRAILLSRRRSKSHSLSSNAPFAQIEKGTRNSTEDAMNKLGVYLSSDHRRVRADGQVTLEVEGLGYLGRPKNKT